MRDWFIEQLAVYAAFHRDRRNQATHHVGVPLIVFSLLVALARLPILSVGEVDISAATILLSLLMAFYLANVPLIGALATFIYGILYVVAEQVAALPAGTAWSLFAASFIGGWAFQFVGHAFEGRRPAFFTNLIQVFMAPPFLIAEMLFGLGLQRGLAGAVDRRSVKYFALRT